MKASVLRYFCGFSFWVPLSGMLMLCAMSPLMAWSQSDTVPLEIFTVEALRLKEDVAGIKTEKLDEAQLSKTSDVGNWLQNRSNITLRGYGPGSSIGISIRGASTSQSQVLINGVAFENPGLGFSDISLLPTSAFTHASIYRGSASAYLGNAAIGGSLVLTANPFSVEESLGQRFTAGSFGSMASVSSAGFKNQRFASSSTVYFRRAENDFWREDPLDPNSRQRQPNAQFQSKGIVQNMGVKTGESGVVNLFLLGSETLREIPPISSKPSANAKQNDQNLRLQGSYSQKWRKHEMNATFAFDYGNQSYSDIQSGLDDASNYRTYHGQVRLARAFGHFHAFAMAVYRASKVKTDYYMKRQSRLSPSGVAGITGHFWEGATSASVLVRQELLNGTALPLIPTFTIAQRLTPHLSFRGAAGLSYRLPTLNDLYWNPGGNINLKPETGQFQELGLDFSSSKYKTTFEASLSAFHRSIDNWILWQPGNGFWSPQNVKSVESKGFEISTNLSHHFGPLAFNHHFSGIYASSINMDKAFDGDNSVGKQLIYIPKWSLFAKEEIEMLQNRLKLILLGRYASIRFVNFDNSKSIDPYFTADFELHYAFNIGNLPISTFAAARNILNTSYQMQAAYPMPGINFEIGAELKFNIKKSKNEN